MFLTMGRQWAVLSVLILADVAPTSSCGSDPVRPDRTVVIEIRASDCACAPGLIQVFMDGRSVGELTCGAEGALTVHSIDGSHVFWASTDELSWLQQTHFVEAGSATIELGCPDG